MEEGHLHVDWSEMLLGEFNLKPIIIRDQSTSSSRLFDQVKIYNFF